MSRILNVIDRGAVNYDRFCGWTLMMTSPSYRQLQADMTEMRRELRRLELMRMNLDEEYRIKEIGLTARPYHFPLPEHLR